MCRSTGRGAAGVEARPEARLVSVADTVDGKEVVWQ